MTKRRIHDGIVGVLLTLSMILGYLANPHYYWIALGLGILLTQSALTGFCPLYWVLDRLVRDRPRSLTSPR